MMEPLQIAMVGGASDSLIGPSHFLGSAWNHRFKLVAGAFSRNKERTKASGSNYNVALDRCYTSIKQLLEAEQKLDAIVIATPNSTHIEYSLLAAKAGLHVLCEKPLGHSRENLGELKSLLLTKKLTFGLAHHNTGYLPIRRIKQIVGSGELGELRLMRASYIQGWLADIHEIESNPQAKWRLDPELSGPSCCLADIGSHVFNLMQFVGGSALESVDTKMDSLTRDRKVDDFCSVRLRFKNSVRGYFVASQVSVGYENEISFHADFEQGSVSWFLDQPNRLKIRTADHSTTLLNFEDPPMSDLQTNLFQSVSMLHPNPKLENIHAFGRLYDGFHAAICQKRAGDLVSIEMGEEFFELLDTADS